MGDSKSNPVGVLVAMGQPGTHRLQVLVSGSILSLDTLSGAFSAPTQRLYYAGANCLGTVFAVPKDSAQVAFASGNPQVGAPHLFQWIGATTLMAYQSYSDALGSNCVTSDGSLSLAPVADVGTMPSPVLAPVTIF